jgi:hypothetical protein
MNPAKVGWPESAQVGSTKVLSVSLNHDKLETNIKTICIILLLLLKISFIRYSN